MQKKAKFELKQIVKYINWLVSYGMYSQISGY